MQNIEIGATGQVIIVMQKFVIFFETSTSTLVFLLHQKKPSWFCEYYIHVLNIWRETTQ